MKEEIFRMERVTYTENEVVMLEDFHLQIYKGEIMGMVPINSHGLSALLKLLQTNLSLYDGYVYYCSELVNSWKEPCRPHNRISIIQAKSSLVERMTVTDNVFVMRESFHQELIRTNLLRRQLQPFLKDIGVAIPEDIRVEELPVFERVVVELLRAVILGNRLIVLNEIGALIGYEEVEELHRILRHYAAQGFSFLYICPHFEEIASICDRAARFTNGRIQKIIVREEMEDEIVRICPEEYRSMVQFHLENNIGDKKSREILRWDYCGALGNETLLTVYEGECLVLQAAENARFQKIADILTGKSPGDSMQMYINEQPIFLFRDRRVAVIQEMATKTMIFPELSYMENLCMALSQRMPSLWINGKIRRNIRKEYGDILGQEVFDMQMEELSEKQKYQLIYTRILLQKPRVVFCIHPFKGADVAHRMFIWQMLEMLLREGIAVVIVSVSLSDSLALADRLLVVEGTGVVKEVPREKFETISRKVPWTNLYIKEKTDQRNGV